MNENSNNIFLSDGKLLTQEAKLNVMSCFDGKSCLRIALEELGIPINKYFASEVDKYAMQVANALFEDTIQLGDIKNIRFAIDGLKVGNNIFEEIHITSEKIHLLAGGSPCQGFSFAGKQLNFEDPRSKLFFEFVRLKKELKPKYFLFENVTMKKVHEDVITSYLGVEPIKLNSNVVSAQNRKRIYWTNLPILGQPENLNIDLEDILEDLPDCPIGIKVREKSNCVRVGGRNSPFGSKQIWDSPFQRVTKKGKVKPGIKKSGCLTGGGNSGGNHSDMDILHTPWATRRYSVTECARLQTIPEKHIKTMLNCGVSNSQLYKMLGNGWTINAIKYFLQGLSEKKEGKKKILLRDDKNEPSSLALI